MTTVTEAQKKQLMIIISVFLALVIYISGIRPMQSKIETNKETLAQVELQRNDMQKIVEDPTIEKNYEELRAEYEEKFQQRFENFKSNELIEAITTEFRQPIRSIRIKNFEPVSPDIYHNYIAQPKTDEELQKAVTAQNSAMFPLLLCSEVNVILNVGLTDELKMYDAFNNIVPVGPGDADPDRYCLLVPAMDLKNLLGGSSGQGAGKTEVSYKILVFAMDTLDLKTWDEEYAARK